MVADDPAHPARGPVNATFDEVVKNELLLGHEDLEGEVKELFRGSDRGLEAPSRSRSVSSS